MKFEEALKYLKEGKELCNDNTSGSIKLCKVFGKDLFCNDGIIYSFTTYDIMTDTWEIKNYLDGIEKEYLKFVLKPFRHEIVSIEKMAGFDTEERLFVNMKKKDNRNHFFYFPSFEKGSMYKGMELNKKYTLSDLGIFYAEDIPFAF